MTPLARTCRAPPGPSPRGSAPPTYPVPIPCGTHLLRETAHVPGSWQQDPVPADRRVLDSLFLGNPNHARLAPITSALSRNTIGPGAVPADGPGHATASILWSPTGTSPPLGQAYSYHSAYYSMRRSAPHPALGRPWSPLTSCLPNTPGSLSTPFTMEALLCSSYSSPKLIFRAPSKHNTC